MSTRKLRASCTNGKGKPEPKNGSQRPSKNTVHNPSLVYSYSIRAKVTLSHRPQHYQFMGATESWQNRVSDATVKLIPGTMASPVWYFLHRSSQKEKCFLFNHHGNKHDSRIITVCFFPNPSQFSEKICKSHPPTFPEIPNEAPTNLLRIGSIFFCLVQWGSLPSRHQALVVAMSWISGFYCSFSIKYFKYLLYIYQ